jgi:hypothetical protein
MTIRHLSFAILAVTSGSKPKRSSSILIDSMTSRRMLVFRSIDQVTGELFRRIGQG